MKRVAAVLLCGLLAASATAAYLFLQRGERVRASSATAGTVRYVDVGLAYPLFKRMAVDSSVNVAWVPEIKGTRGNLLWRISTSDGNRASYALPTLPGNSSDSAVVVDSKAVWIAYGRALVRFDKQTSQTASYQFPSVNYSRKATDVPGWEVGTPVVYGIRDAAEDRDGHIWIARENANSLLEFDPSASTFGEVPLSDDFGSPDEITANGQGEIWMKTGRSGRRGKSGLPLVSNQTAVLRPDRSFEAFEVPADHVSTRGDTVIATFDSVKRFDRRTVRGGGQVVASLASVSPFARVMTGADGRTFVADADAVLLLDASDQVVRKFGVPGKYPDPEAVAKNHMMVPGAATAGQAPRALTNPPPPMFGDWGFDADGDLVVAITNQNRIAVLK